MYEQLEEVSTIRAHRVLAVEEIPPFGVVRCIDTLPDGIMVVGVPTDECQFVYANGEFLIPAGKYGLVQSRDEPHYALCSSPPVVDVPFGPVPGSFFLAKGGLGFKGQGAASYTEGRGYFRRWLRPVDEFVVCDEFIEITRDRTVVPIKGDAIHLFSDAPYTVIGFWWLPGNGTRKVNVTNVGDKPIEFEAEAQHRECWVAEAYHREVEPRLPELPRLPIPEIPGKSPAHGNPGPGVTGGGDKPPGDSPVNAQPNLPGKPGATGAGTDTPVLGPAIGPAAAQPKPGNVTTDGGPGVGINPGIAIPGEQPRVPGLAPGTKGGLAPFLPEMRIHTLSGRNVVLRPNESMWVEVIPEDGRDGRGRSGHVTGVILSKAPDLPVFGTTTGAPTLTAPLGAALFDPATCLLYIQEDDDGDGTGDSWCSGSGYTDEQAQDAVAGMLAATSTVDFTYDDGTNTLTLDVLASGLISGSAGQLVVVNGTADGFDAATLTAGTGITVTPGVGTIEVSFSGTLAITVETSTGSPSVAATQITFEEKHFTLTDAGGGEATVKVRQHGAMRALVARSFV